MNKMERTVLMVHHEQRLKLLRLANQEHVSAAEINRRAIDAYEPTQDAPAEIELDLLARAVIRSNKQAMHMIEEARKTVKETIAYFRNKSNPIGV